MPNPKLEPVLKNRNTRDNEYQILEKSRAMSRGFSHVLGYTPFASTPRPEPTKNNRLEEQNKIQNEQLNEHLKDNSLVNTLSRTSEAVSELGLLFTFNSYEPSPQVDNTAALSLALNKQGNNSSLMFNKPNAPRPTPSPSPNKKKEQEEEQNSHSYRR